MRTIATPMPSKLVSIERRRPILPVATLLLAAAAAVLAAVDIRTDRVYSREQRSTPAVAAIASPNADTVAPEEQIIVERDGGACRLRAITRPCP